MHRILIALIALVAALATPVVGSAAIQPATPVFDTYLQPGPFSVEVGTVSYASGQSGVIYQPATDDDSSMFPVVIWGNGTSAEPEANYGELLRHIASWGYVIAASDDQQVGTGEPLLEALADLRTRTTETAFPLADRVDFSLIAAVGHSQGAGGSMRAAINHLDIDTVIPIALPNRDFVGAGDEYDPADLTVPAFFMGGKNDTIISPLAVNQAFFAETPGPAALAFSIDSDHNGIQGDGGDYRSYIVAWLDFVLRGDREAAAAFQTDNAELLTNPAFEGQAVKDLATDAPTTTSTPEPTTTPETTSTPTTTPTTVASATPSTTDALTAPTASGEVSKSDTMLIVGLAIGSAFILGLGLTIAHRRRNHSQHD